MRYLLFTKRIIRILLPRVILLPSAKPLRVRVRPRQQLRLPPALPHVRRDVRTFFSLLFAHWLIFTGFPFLLFYYILALSLVALKRKQNNIDQIAPITHPT